MDRIGMGERLRAIVFIDYWNLYSTLQKEDGKEFGLTGPRLRSHRFDIDWYRLGPILTEIASTKASPFLTSELPLSYEETRIYTSSDPDDSKYKQWAVHQLGRQPGIRVACLPRKPRHAAICPNCLASRDICPHCQTPVHAMQEKGVDTLLVTDLIGLGLDKAYDVAILVTQDADMVPAVSLLSNRGIKVIQVGIKQIGQELGAKCWADFDLFPIRKMIARSNQKG